MTIYRTHNCDALRPDDVMKEVVLSGWVHNRRDHGGVLFLDLRDHFGITQLVIHENVPFYEQITHLQKETVIKVGGVVKHRDPELVNPDIHTGEVEVEVRAFEILGPAAPLPFSVFPEDPTSEELRLKYRFLDLRRQGLHSAIVLRSEIVRAVREKMHAMGFLEMQTPILTASSPEGARDFLVPSRLHPGKFYALPQAPQQFKQLLMVAGFDRYFQIAPCFRDEDARANRSPGEFYQIDMEMSFVDQDDVFRVIEKLLFELFEDFSDALKEVDRPPFIRIPYRKAMDRYGSDKPDLRIPIVLRDVSSIFEKSQFDMFKKQVQKGAVVKAIPVKGIASRGKSFCESLLSFAMSKQVGAKGLAYIIWKDGEASGKPITNHLSAEEIEEIRIVCGLTYGDVVFFACEKPDKASAIAGRVREEIGRRLTLDIETFAPAELETTDDMIGVRSLYDKITSALPDLIDVKSKEAALKAIKVAAVSDKPAALFDEIIAEAQSIGTRCLFYIAYTEGEPIKSDMAAMISEKDLKVINDRIRPNKNQDVVFFVYDKGVDATKGARLLRKDLSRRFSLPQVDEFKFCWIVDFPMYERDEKSGQIGFSHNPFSMPVGGLDALMHQDPLDILAYQYDIVCNGEELSSGAIRNHRSDIMYKVFEIAGYSASEVDEKFGGMITAFRLGAPPHGGIAPGLDRIVMLLADKQNLREVVAFPMNQMAEDLMMDAPRQVTEAQLRELGLKIDLVEE